MKFLVYVFLIVFMGFVVCDVSIAKEQVTTPKHNSPERKLIANALRTVVEKELKKPIIFKINTLNVQNNWAFLSGMPLEKNGKRIDYNNTPYQEMIDAGIFDDWICALLHKKGNSWEVIIHVIGATDVPFVDWAKKYHAPAAIFKLD
ncbi:MAG: hypothetical protein LUO95_01845 [Methylococcaceae bacterium]|nr:hypothetical protein [Methylococcaceae bacterium]MDD1609372.1 hypothetical protein [Methylococcaceae bacterium]MDD1616931.1 hypothetical protein [Methylococcaceae bacterium]OYV16457.1 MAG: hypothetical protein CG439_2106 [Methylococcaceae bacterium NSP1-2]